MGIQSTIRDFILHGTVICPVCSTASGCGAMSYTLYTYVWKRLFSFHPYSCVIRVLVVCSVCACVLVYHWPPQFVDIDFSFHFRHFSTHCSQRHTQRQRIQSREHRRTILLCDSFHFVVCWFHKISHKTATTTHKKST